MALEEYRKKRDFKRTPEPGGTVAKHRGEPIFVIQEHHATRLHYDFRLEADGVLKSWAVTKEPTLDPSIKRLAVEVEDHPLGYATFSGDIPAGEYGGGHVEIWDHGTYRNIMLEKPEPATITEGIAAGHLEFELHGERLQGRFAMIRMKDHGPKHNWLFIKMKDEFALPPEEHGEKPATEERASRSKKPKSGANDGSTKRAPAASGAGRTKAASRDGEAREIEFSHLDKVMFPESGYTKGELIDYYRSVADRLLPHLRDRPVTLERLPDGIREGAPRFWQKNTPSYYPAWIKRVELESEEGKPVNYALVNDVETLLYLVNQGAITFHVWQSRIGSPDQPDYLVFDLDPGERPFTDVVAVARTLHGILEDEKIDVFVKTSGKSGMHLIVPWTVPGGYDEAREWAVEVGQRAVAEAPAIATMERSKSNRGGRLYLDVMQNVRGRHVVPPYVVRAVPAATVSAPLTWREVTPKLTPAKFDIKSMPGRISRQKQDPLHDLVRIIEGITRG